MAEVLQVISGVNAAKMQKNAGKIRQYESEVEAAQIETASAQREADRKEALARAVSSQNAAVGGSGISFEGSPLSILVEDQRREAEGTGRDELMSRLGASAARTRGKVAKSMGRAQSRITLMNTTADAFKSGQKAMAAT